MIKNKALDIKLIFKNIKRYFKFSNKFFLYNNLKKLLSKSIFKNHFKKELPNTPLVL